MVKFELDTGRAVEALVYLASRTNDFTKYKAAKLMFLADKLHLVQHGRPISGDAYFALRDGPIPSATLDFLNSLLRNKLDPRFPPSSKDALLIERGEWPRFVATRPANTDLLSESDIEALDETLRRFGSLGFLSLWRHTHRTPAYKEAWSSRGVSERAAMDFEKFFEGDLDKLDGAREEMLENSAIREALSGG